MLHGLAYTLEVRRLEDAVVTELTFCPRIPYERDTMNVEQKIRAEERFAENMIAKL